MGGVMLELKCPKKVYGIEQDPNPDWTFDDLISELNALDIRISGGSNVPVTFVKEKGREILSLRSNGKSPGGPFVMRVFDDDMDDFDGEDTGSSDGEDEGVHDQRPSGGRTFKFDNLYLSDSDDSGDEAALATEPYLMEKVDLAECNLRELSRDYQLKVKEEIRNQILALETELKRETDKSVSALARVEKYRKERSEMDRRLDTQYQRRIAEALDDHLTVVQRDLEVVSQIEERKIRNDAAYEDAKRKEAEEKLRQERAKAEAEAKRAEEAKRAAMEAQRRAADEAAAKRASEASKKPDTDENNSQSGGPQVKKPVTAANNIRAAESALILEQGRLQKLKKLDEEVKELKLRSNEKITKYERSIAKSIKQITGTTEVVRQKEYELLKIFCDPNCPQSISISALAKKVVATSKQPGNPAFAQAFIIVRITSKAPHAMDLILAELNKACIYTVPKHYSRSAFGSSEDYHKALGFQEDDEGKVETVDSYLGRVKSYMKLYGAIVQTDNNNVHGLKEGWAWLARFVNALPANRYTAVALSAFVEMAGYALFRKYRNQFLKLLNMVSDNFLNALKEQGDSQLSSVIAEIGSYIHDRKFLREPEGRQLKSDLQSDRCVP